VGLSLNRDGGGAPPQSPGAELSQPQRTHFSTNAASHRAHSSIRSRYASTGTLTTQAGCTWSANRSWYRRSTLGGREKVWDARCGTMLRMPGNVAALIDLTSLPAEVAALDTGHLGRRRRCEVGAAGRAS
jgi:hypothetical protein